jgi:hypothetical protein
MMMIPVPPVPLFDNIPHVWKIRASSKRVCHADLGTGGTADPEQIESTRVMGCTRWYRMRYSRGTADPGS